MPPPFPDTIIGNGRDRVTDGSCERHDLRAASSGSADLLPRVQPLQLGHKDTKTRLSAGIPLSLLFTTVIRNGNKGRLHIYFIGMAMSLFRVTKSTGDLLALVKATDPPSALEAYARMRGHLSFARLASACGLAFAEAQKAFLTQEVGSTQAQPS
jgi:hypothetical protein